MAGADGQDNLEKTAGQGTALKDSQLAITSDPPSETSSQGDLDEKDGAKAARREAPPVLDRHITQASSVATRDLEGQPQQEPHPKTWYDRINPLKMRRIPPIPAERGPSREYSASFLSLLTFQWMSPLMNIGYLRPLELGDIWLVNPDRSAEVMTEKMMASFKMRAAREDSNPLVGALHETFKHEFWLGGMCNLVSSVFQVITPFTTRFLIQYANDAYVAQRTGAPAPHIAKGIGLTIGITLMQIFQSLGTNHFIYRGMMVGGEARAVLITAVFEKALKISGRAKAGGKALHGEKSTNGIDIEELKNKKDSLLDKVLKKKRDAKATPDKADGVFGDGTGWGNGRIVTLMSVDTYRVDQASGLFHLIWSSPIAICITLVVLCINLGASALAGYALLVLSIPVLTLAIKALFRRRRKINKMTDQRVSLTQEIIQSVRFVKYFGWESSFLERLKEIRGKEIRAIQILLAIRNAINAVSMAMPVFASMLAFITYQQTNHSLNPAYIFSSLALFNSLRMPLNLLPLVIGQVTDAYASLGRIQDFLLAEERVEDTVWDEEMENAVEAQNASFTWERAPDQKEEDVSKGQANGEKKLRERKKAQDEKRLSKDDISERTEIEAFRICDIDISIGRNELIAVIGTVGSGKSSLLAALAGDMRMTGGKLKLGASRAFCPQYAWIQNASLKDNILFGKAYDPKWYNEVIDACALRPDLEILPAGDGTEIGERGITLSGGQKQRLNIGRAIYFDADIILMDDPLSAVDAHVGRHIMDKAICGILKDKCRILATHQLHVLNRCDRIIWMDEGRILAIDTFDNLMQDHVGFQKLMATTAQEEHGEQRNKDDSEDTEGKKDDKKQKKPKQLMTVEERAVRSVSWSVWGAYIKASGSILFAPLVIFALLCSQGANIATSLWLSYWTSNKFPGLSNADYIGIYVGLGFIQALLMYIYSTLLTTTGTNASKTLLQGAMTRVLRAPMSFFDTTPLGRITNRFSKDIDSMDNNLTDAMRMYFLTMAMITAVFALIISFFYYFAIALVPLFFLFIFAASYYRASAREVKRHEAVLRSHVFARFGEAVSGVASIRAYRLQGFFTEKIRDAVDQMDSAYYLTFANQRWLSVRLDLIGNCLVFTVGILVVTSRFSVNPSIGGLVLSYILAIVQMIQFSVRQLAEVENNMNATERIHYYATKLEEEAPLHLQPMNPSWPEKGQITFDNVSMRYRPELPLVLRDLNLDIKGGERIGIVGRTGAGKSSIMSALFRLTELSAGRITVDGIDISKVGLADLRTKLSIIPQDPTLFRGTIRSNLDPFNQHTDDELLAALRQADLIGNEDGAEAEGRTEPTAATTSSSVQQSPSFPSSLHHRKAFPSTNLLSAAATQRITLNTSVEEEGLNFSLGQRQLMALARALVRNTRIIVCDEATSSVDFSTDARIQRTIATGFKGRTLLCIAHRLKTILNYDRICVMDEGGVAEWGGVEELFLLGEEGEEEDDEEEEGKRNGSLHREGADKKRTRRKKGIFRGMCERSGIGLEEIRRAQAEAREGL